MAVVIVLEDAWDGHWVLSSALHQAGHRVLAVQHPAQLSSTLSGSSADLVVVDAAMPGVCLNRIATMSADAGIPLIATGYSPFTPMRGLAAFLPKPAALEALLHAASVALESRQPACAA